MFITIWTFQHGLSFYQHWVRVFCSLKLPNCPVMFANITEFKASDKSKSQKNRLGLQSDANVRFDNRCLSGRVLFAANIMDRLIFIVTLIFILLDDIYTSPSSSFHKRKKNLAYKAENGFTCWTTKMCFAICVHIHPRVCVSVHFIVRQCLHTLKIKKIIIKKNHKLNERESFLENNPCGGKG